MVCTVFHVDATASRFSRWLCNPCTHSQVGLQKPWDCLPLSLSPGTLEYAFLARRISPAPDKLGSLPPASCITLKNNLVTPNTLWKVTCEKNTNINSVAVRQMLNL